MNEIASFFGHGEYIGRLQCLHRDWLLVMLYIAGDIVVGASIVSVALTLIRKRNASFQFSPRARALCGAFLVMLATSYLVRILTFFWGVYRLEAFVLTLLAGVSISLAIVVSVQFARGKR